jgi:hypothetical protein
MVRVRDTIEAILYGDDIMGRGLTYTDLARRVYDTATPTAAQKSAVRRAVANLVDAGIAERHERYRYGGEHTHTRTIPVKYVRHITRPDGQRVELATIELEAVECRNPGETQIRRAGVAAELRRRLGH